MRNCNFLLLFSYWPDFWYTNVSLLAFPLHVLLFFNHSPSCSRTRSCKLQWSMSSCSRRRICLNPSKDLGLNQKQVTTKWQVFSVPRVQCRLFNTHISWTKCVSFNKCLWERDKETKGTLEWPVGCSGQFGQQQQGFSWCWIKRTGGGPAMTLITSEAPICTGVSPPVN